MGGIDQKHPFAARVGLIIFAGAMFGAIPHGDSAQAQGAASAPPLYKRVGGYDAIAAVTDDFLGRLAADKQLAPFLVGLSADSQKETPATRYGSALRSHRRAMHLYRANDERFACRPGY
jgi:hypothetical protein